MTQLTQKIPAPSGVVYVFPGKKVNQLPYIDLRYKAYIYGMSFHGLCLCKNYAPKASWDEATKDAAQRGERLMKIDELQLYWDERKTIDTMMQLFRQYGICADNVCRGMHWAWADWTGIWKDALYNGTAIPRFHEDIELVRTVLA